MTEIIIDGITIELPRKVDGMRLSETVLATAQERFRSTRRVVVVPQDTYRLTYGALHRDPGREIHEISILSDYYLKKALVNFGVCWALPLFVLPPLLSPLALVYGGRHRMRTDIRIDQEYKTLTFERLDSCSDQTFERRFRPEFETYLSDLITRL